MRETVEEKAHRMMMEVDDGESGEGPSSFWVVRVPQAVFSTDPEETLRVRRCYQYHTHTHIIVILLLLTTYNLV